MCFCMLQSSLHGLISQIAHPSLRTGQLMIILKQFILKLNTADYKSNDDNKKTDHLYIIIFQQKNKGINKHASACQLKQLKIQQELLNSQDTGQFQRREDIVARQRIKVSRGNIRN